MTTVKSSYLVDGVTRWFYCWHCEHSGYCDPPTTTCPKCGKGEATSEEITAYLTKRREERIEKRARQLPLKRQFLDEYAALCRRHSIIITASTDYDNITTFDTDCVQADGVESHLEELRKELNTN